MRLESSKLHEHVEMFADAVTSNGKWKHTKFFIGKYIPEKKLKNAMASYAQLSNDEVPLLLIDDTLFGSAKDGLLMTTSNLYYSTLLKPGETPETGKGCIPLSDIQSIYFDSDDNKISSIAASGTIVHINSAPFAYLSNKPFTEITALNDLFSKLSTVGHVDE
ncbi:MAG: hypothetical protein ACOYIF_09670, partial [Acetivibrionales bacterium]